MTDQEITYHSLSNGSRSQPRKRVAYSIVICGIPVTVCWEVLGKRYGYYRPTQAIQFATRKLSNIAQIIGKNIAKISDLVGFVRNVLTTIRRILGPYFEEFATAISEIFKDMTGLIVQPVQSFMKGYTGALEHVYNQLFTILVTCGYIFGGSAVIMLTLECIGLVFNKTNYRPSTWIKCLAKWIMDNCAFVSESYLKVCNLCGHLMKIYQRYKIYLEPYVKRIGEASCALGKASHELIGSPFEGTYLGITNAWKKIDSPLARNITTATAGACGVFITWLAIQWFTR